MAQVDGRSPQHCLVSDYPEWTSGPTMDNVLTYLLLLAELGADIAPVSPSQQAAGPGTAAEGLRAEAAGAGWGDALSL